MMSENGPNEEGEEPRLGGVISVDSERMSPRRGSSQSFFSWHHQLCELRLQMSLSDSLSNHWCRMKKWMTPPFCWQQWIAKGWNDGAVSHLFTHFVLSVVVHYSHMLEGSLVLTAVLPWRFQIKQGLHSQQNSLKFSDRFCTGFGGNRDKISESGWGIRDGFSWMSRWIRIGPMKKGVEGGHPRASMIWFCEPSTPGIVQNAVQLPCRALVGESWEMSGAERQRPDHK